MLTLFACSKNESNNTNAPLLYVEVAPEDVVTQRRATEEKITIKKLPLNCYQFTHSNVCFDFHSNVSVDVSVNDSTVVINEIGSYGYEGIYRYFTINGIFSCNTDSMKNVTVKRNGNTRANFKVDF